VALKNKTNTLSAMILLTVTAFSCSMPIFSKNQGTGTATSSNDKNFQPKPAKLSGVLELHEGCLAGYYQIRLQGIFEGANVQVESQTDESGHFNLLAPPGRYVMMVNKDSCGSKQTIELEENTEHMFSVIVQETKAVEKFGLNQNHDRLPASVLIEPKR
jgi:hypothetical protein